MRRPLTQRELAFAVIDGHLVRTVTGNRADSGPRTYTHRCERQVFETVAHAVHETPEQGEGTTLQAIARQERLPCTQVNVALEFLKERGRIDVRGRRCYPATADTHLDAMIEFHALAEQPPPPPPPPEAPPPEPPETPEA
jgi:hypothetical protein